MQGWWLPQISPLPESRTLQVGHVSCFFPLLLHLMPLLIASSEGPPQSFASNPVLFLLFFCLLEVGPCFLLFSFSPSASSSFAFATSAY